MDSNNWRAAQGQVQIPGQVIGGDAVAAAGMEGGDWRNQLQPDSRLWLVNMIMETLKKHLPFSGQEGLQELIRIAVRFEEEIYTAATSQSDYLRTVSLKMLKIEMKSQNPMANSLQSNAASNSRDPQDPDSLSQTGNASGGDWQEEIYQKIKSMHQMYYPELNEMCQRMAAKLQQHDALPQQPKNEQVEKLRFLMVVSERLIIFLRTNKNEIQPQHKEKIAGVEKQIVNILNANRPRKPVSLQQGLTQPHMHAMQQSQQHQPQISQMHTNEGEMNSQMQPMNVQGSVVTTQQNNLTNLQHNSLSSVSSVSNSRQNMMEALQPGSQSQIQNQVQQLPIPMVPNQSQVWQQLLSQNIQNNIPSTGVPNSAGLTSALPPVGGMSQGTMPNVLVQNPNMQNMLNMSNVTPNAVGNSMGQGVSSTQVQEACLALLGLTLHEFQRD